MMIIAFSFGVIALGLFVGACLAIAKGVFGRAALLAVLAFVMGGAAGALAAAA